MNIVSEKNEVLNANVSIQDIDGHFGLVMESRGGAKGKSNERNTDYLPALDTVLSRISKSSAKTINVFIVSAKALNIWTMEERALEIDGSKNITLSAYDLKTLRGQLCKAQQNKKENAASKGGNPTKRILIESELSAREWKDIVLGTVKVHTISNEEVDSQSEAFNPADAEKAKEKVTRSIANRRGQPKFRKSLLKAYKEQCAITKCNIPAILEAAHIVPYQGVNTNHITNGILLRADIHTLFDLGLIGVNRSYKVVVSSSLIDSEYEKYNGREIHFPEKKVEQPSLVALESRALPYRH